MTVPRSPPVGATEAVLEPRSLSRRNRVGTSPTTCRGHPSLERGPDAGRSRATTRLCEPSLRWAQVDSSPTCRRCPSRTDRQRHRHLGPWRRLRRHTRIQPYRIWGRTALPAGQVYGHMLRVREREVRPCLPFQPELSSGDVWAPRMIMGRTEADVEPLLIPGT